eukprot:1157990-Pelagomonas_calceolata.AAC.4
MTLQLLAPTSCLDETEAPTACSIATHLNDHFLQVPVGLGAHAIALKDDGSHEADFPAVHAELIGLQLTTSNSKAQTLYCNCHCKCNRLAWDLSPAHTQCLRLARAIGPVEATVTDTF